MLTLPFLKYSFFKFDLENSRSGSWESAKFKVTKCVPLAINTHLSFSVWKVAGPHALNLKAWELSVFIIIFPLKTHLSSLSTPTHLISFSFLSSWACAGRYHLLSSCCTICGPPSVPYVLSRAINRAAVPSVLHLPSYTFHPSPSLSRTIPAATGAICPVSAPSTGCIVPLPIRSTAEWNLTWSELNIIIIFFKWDIYIKKISTAKLV